MKNIAIDPQNWQDLPSYRRNVLLTGADLNSRGARMQIVSIKAGAHVGLHYHKTSYEVYVALQGQCDLLVNGEEILLQPGTMLLIEPGDRHELFNNGTEEFQLLVFKTNSSSDDIFWIDRS